uniref:Uncharacterized protein n=1 Tax=Anguilla anguilla TaxID=7936 RepID=A0A0E9VRK1_ANGAN
MKMKMNTHTRTNTQHNNSVIQIKGIPKSSLRRFV